MHSAWQFPAVSTGTGGLIKTAEYKYITSQFIVAVCYVDIDIDIDNDIDIDIDNDNDAAPKEHCANQAGGSIG
jgi:hypothetical protein